MVFWVEGKVEVVSGVRGWGLLSSMLSSPGWWEAASSKGDEQLTGPHPQLASSHVSQCQVCRRKISYHLQICFSSLNVLCFPFTIGKVKITIFHLLVACTFVFTYLWGYVIYNTIIKNQQVISKFLISNLLNTDVSFSGWYETCSRQSCSHYPELMIW